MFSTWTKGLSAEHTDAILFDLLPTAAALTTGELAAAIARAAIALDPEWTRRRYEAALRGRRVVGRRNPDGTGSLTGHDLPLDEMAAACEHLDALARAAKAAGHPDRLDHLRADLLLGLLTGRYEGLTDPQILATLKTTTPTSTGADPAPRRRRRAGPTLRTRSLTLRTRWRRTTRTRSQSHTRSRGRRRTRSRTLMLEPAADAEPTTRTTRTPGA